MADRAGGAVEGVELASNIPPGGAIMSSFADRVRRALSELAARLGITSALVYTILGRVWSVMAGPVTLVLVGRFLSPEQQGFYYTFWSVLGLWVFFDLGLGLVIVQFASHERAALHFENGRMIGDPRAKGRLASLFRLALRWYACAGLLMLAVILPGGALFFDHYRVGEVEWFWPWILVSLTVTINLFIGPLASILEGSGLFHDVALMRLAQAMTANGFLWIALLLGADLYSAVVLNGFMALVGMSWLFSRHRGFFRDLWSVRSERHRIRWREELWPFQWRLAVSWLASYFMFQIFNPIVFAASGPIAAGQMGMSLMMTTTIGLFAQAWITTRSVDYGALVASRKYGALDRSFRATLVQSVVVVVLLASIFLIAIEGLRRIGHPLATRVLSPLPLLLLIAATLLNHIVNTEASYLRAWRREPFVVIYAPMSVVTAVGSLLVAARFGVTGMVSVLLAAVAIIGVGGGTILFQARRRDWRDKEPLDAAVATEMLRQ